MEPMKTPEAVAPGIVTLAKVKEKFDVLTAIKREVGKIGKGQLIPEALMCERTSGRDRNRFRRTVENNADELTPFRVKLRLDDSSEGKWYWGRAEDVAEAVRIRDL